MLFMVTIDSAYCDEYKRIMSFDEITQDKKFEVIKHTLYCSTEGCPSRLSYVRGDKACLRTYRGDNHSEDCKDAFERIKKAQKAEKIESAFVLLTENEFNKKHKYLLKKYLKKDNEDGQKPKPSGRRKKPNKTIDVTTAPLPYTEAKLGTGETGGETVEELKEKGKIVRGPSFPAKELNQISEEDIGSKCGIVAEVTKVTKVRDKTYEITVKQGSYKGILLLPESFFATQYVDADSYIDEMGNFVNEIKHFSLNVLTYCEINKVEGTTLKLSVLEYTWLAVSVSKPPIKVLKLPKFVALYTRGNYSE
jgi:hypothetical protein